MRRAGKAKRGLALALALATSFLLSGCVYLRLLQLKQQMGEFDRNFGIESENGVAIVCRNPVLLSADINWIGLGPESVSKGQHLEHWQVRWIKQLPPGISEAGEFDIRIQLSFTDDRLSRVFIPERYFAVMPKALLVDLLRSLGGAKVDKGQRSVEAKLSASRPGLGEIETLLGRPSERTEDGPSTLLRYRYIPSARGKARSATFDMLLTFDTASGQLMRWKGDTPVGAVGFSFEETPQ